MSRTVLLTGLGLLGTSSSLLLEKILEKELFISHEIGRERGREREREREGERERERGNTNLSVLLEKYSSSLLPNEKVPIVFCVPTDSVREREEELRETALSLSPSFYLDFVSVLHEEDKTCLLAHMAPASLLLLKDDEWEYEYLPPLLKVHQSVLEYLTNDDLNKRHLKSIKDEIIQTTDIPLPEGMSLTIQFVREGLEKSVDNLFADILKSWQHYTSFDHGLEGINDHYKQSRWSNDESPIQSRWTHLMKSVASDHLSKFKSNSFCSFPHSTSFEHESSVSRVNDLSGWEFTSSTTSSLSLDSNKHSTYCFMSLVENIASHPSVLSVTVQGRPILLNYDARGVIQSGNSAYTPFSDAGLYGEGHIVGVADSGLDDYSCFFWDNSGYYSSPATTRSSYTGPKVEPYRRKVVEYVAYADSYDTAAGHGTHVVGTIVGNSIFDGYSKANGIAPAAKVAFYDVMVAESQYLSIPDTYTYVYTSLYNAGARVLSNSWGSYTTESQYTERQYDADNFAYKFPDTLIVFAAGNSGANGYKSAYSPCTAKNVLCVGAVELRDDASDDVVPATESRIAYFSSLGPTFDGRNKPDVVAPGFKIVSAMSSGPSGDQKSCATYETFGTSMAAPVVSGSAIILREYFIDHYLKVCHTHYSFCKSFTPSGYLLKTVLIHSSIPVKKYSSYIFDAKTSLDSFTLGATPDSVQGYGEINLLNAVPVTVDDRKAQDLYVVDAFSFAGKSNYILQLEVEVNDKPLRVTIAWYDPPSAITSAYNLLARNLNLYIRHVDSGAKWYGNNADPSRMDSVNPQEQITVTTPAPGKYEVYVSSPSTSYATNAAVAITCHGSVLSEFTIYTGSLNEVFPLESDLSLSTQEVLQQISSNAKAGDEKSLATLPFFMSSMSKVVNIPLDVTLQPMTTVCVQTFEVTSSSDQVHSITIDLNAALHGGSAAFILGVLISSPNGELIQVGGYLNYETSNRLWSRMWPVQWASAPSPPDGSSRYTSTRFLLDSELKEVGTWEVCVKMLYEEWEPTHYQGSITINFVDYETITSESKTKNAFSSNMKDMTIALSVFGAGLVIAVVIGVGLRGRAQSVQKPKSKPRRGAKSHANQSSGKNSGLDDDNEEAGMGMAPIRRKKGTTTTNQSPNSFIVSNEIDGNENLNPMLNEDIPSSSTATTPNMNTDGLWAHTPVRSAESISSDSPAPESFSGSGGMGMLASLISAKQKYQVV